ncbi:pyridoxamine 5'-phosphate oxidase family protein [Ewingella allii]|uniref:pyridoxamine 5'-phosphate oxidase family protein n=1 Tax=Ewingella allii TaxID=3092550 RepID=UPI0037963BC5
MSESLAVNDVFHPDERRAQALAQFDITSAPIRAAMPEQHRTFFAGLPYLLASTIDDEGWPLATLFTGPPGFVSSPDDTHLRINAPRRQDDPALNAMFSGKEIGILGIDFSNRRRNRANGRIGRMDKNRIEIAVDQSFGNCPKYIQIREIYPVDSATPPAAREDLAQLDDEARALIHRADTLFVASHAYSEKAQGGADVSHRGGQPCFVKIDGNRLWIPDFVGNNFMNTLGNLLAKPRAALLFPDFDTGDILHLQGTTEIVWQPETIKGPEGAQRYWCVDVQRAWRFRQALPWRGRNVEYSPASLGTGQW